MMGLDATLCDGASATIEHAYFGNGSTLRLFAKPDDLWDPDRQGLPQFVPIYTGDALVGWIRLKCIGIFNGQLAFEAVELCSADFQVPSESRILIFA